jgi:hypothetical protein
LRPRRSPLDQIPAASNSTSETAIASNSRTDQARTPNIRGNKLGEFSDARLTGFPRTIVPFVLKQIAMTEDAKPVASTTIRYVNRAFAATAVASISRLAHNRG